MRGWVDGCALSRPRVRVMVGVRRGEGECPVGGAGMGGCRVRRCKGEEKSLGHACIRPEAEGWLEQVQGQVQARRQGRASHLDVAQCLHLPHGSDHLLPPARVREGARPASLLPGRPKAALVPRAATPTQHPPQPRQPPHGGVCGSGSCRARSPELQAGWGEVDGGWGGAASLSDRRRCSTSGIVPILLRTRLGAVHGAARLEIVEAALGV